MDWNTTMTDNVPEGDGGYSPLPEGTNAQLTILSTEKDVDRQNECPRLVLKIRASAASGRTATLYERISLLPANHPNQIKAMNRLRVIFHALGIRIDGRTIGDAVRDLKGAQGRGILGIQSNNPNYNCITRWQLPERKKPESTVAKPEAPDEDCPF